MLAEGIERLTELQQRLYADDTLVGADRAAGDGRRRQGQPDQARDERRSIRRASRCIRSSSRARRSSTTISSGASRKRLPARGRIGIFNRSHYEEVLAVRVHRGAARRGRSCREQLDRQGDLGAPLRRHPRLRAASGAQRHRGPQVLPQRFAGGAAQALPRPPRRAGQALEILDGRRRRAQAVAEIHGGL